MAGAKVPIFGSLLVQKDTTSGRLTAISLGSHYKGEFDPREFGAVCDGVTDDTAALQACVNACIAALNAGVCGAAVKLSGFCAISSPITATNVTGLVIDGIGVGTSGFVEVSVGGQGLAGALGMFVWNNCRNCVITDRVSFVPSVHWGVLSAPIAQGALTCTVARWIAGTPVIGQRVTLANQTTSRFSEEIGVMAVTPTTITFTRPTQYAYSTNDIVGFGVEACPVSFNTHITNFTGSVTLAAGNAITFGTSQTMAQGTALCFAAQPNRFYYLAAAVSGTSGTLTATYTGPVGASTCNPGQLNATANIFLGAAGSNSVYHAQKGAFSTPRGGGPAFLASNTLGVNVSTLSGTALVLSGPATMPAGTTLQFSSQAGAYYQLASPMVASASGTLTATYTGGSAVGASVVQNAAVSAGDTVIHVVDANPPGGVAVGQERGICAGQRLEFQAGPTGGLGLVTVSGAPTWNATTLCWDVPLVSAVSGLSSTPTAIGQTRCGLASNDDANNDEMIFGGNYNNILLGAIAFEGLNALGNRVPSCHIEAQCAAAFWLPRGGSVQVFGANLFCSGSSHYTQGGFVEHMSTFSGVITEDSAAHIYIPQGLYCWAPTISIFGLDGHGGPGGGTYTLPNNATVSNNSTAINFNANVTLPIGTKLRLLTDANTLYQLAQAVNNASTGTLTLAYQGAGSGVSTGVQYTQRTIDVLAFGASINISNSTINAGGFYVQDPLALCAMNFSACSISPSDISLGNCALGLTLTPLTSTIPSPYRINGFESVNWGPLAANYVVTGTVSVPIQTVSYVDLTGSAISIACPTLALGQSVEFKHEQFDPGTHSFTVTSPAGVLFGTPGSTATSSSIVLNSTTNNGFSFALINLGRTSSGTPVYAQTGSLAAAGAGYTPPTGTGIPHITAGAQDGAAIHGTADQLFGANHAGTDAAFFTLSGDATIASGALTMATVNSNVGTFGSTSTISQITVKCEGLRHRGFFRISRCGGTSDNYPDWRCYRLCLRREHCNHAGFRAIARDYSDRGHDGLRLGGQYRDDYGQAHGRSRADNDRRDRQRAPMGCCDHGSGPISASRNE